MIAARSIRTLAGGFAIAAVIAFTMAVPTIGTLSSWKIVLGVIGLMIFVRAGRS